MSVIVIPPSLLKLIPRHEQNDAISENFPMLSILNAELAFALEIL